MQSSSIWVAEEVTKKSLKPLGTAIESAFKNKARKKEEQEEEYEYMLNEVRVEDGYTIGKLLKFKKDKEIDSVDIQSNEVKVEKTQNNPLVGYSNFMITDTAIFIEQKGKMLGQRQALKTLMKYGSGLSIDVRFILLEEAVADFIEESEKIKVIRFSKIVENPDNPDKNIQAFEDVTISTNAAGVEFTGKKDGGVNSDSKIVKGGLTLVNKNRAKVKIINSEGKSFNSDKGRNKVKETVSYEENTRDNAVLAWFKRRARMK